MCLLPLLLLKTELQRQGCLKDYFQYQKCIEKFDNCVLRISFLEKCRDANIIPKFLKFRVPNNGCFSDSSVKDFQRRLLHKEIGKANSTLKDVTCQLEEKRGLFRENYQRNV